MPGPPPKRDAERRRRNKSPIETVAVDIDELIKATVEIPKPPTRWVKDPDAVDEDGSYDEDLEGAEEVEPGREGYHEVSAWHPVAEQAYWSLAASGQAIFMEPSDWMTAYALCEMLSRELKPKPMTTVDSEGATSIQWVIQPVNGAVMNAFLKGWASLMATEGDRRRLHIELERKKATAAALAGDGKVADIAQKRADVFRQRARG